MRTSSRWKEREEVAADNDSDAWESAEEERSGDERIISVKRKYGG